MSKRNLAPPDSPDVTYDTDDDGTKVIIRKFDIPLPAKCNNNVPMTKYERWRYKHDVPPGRICTTRIHKTTLTTPDKGRSTPPTSSSSSAVSKGNKQNIEERKDLILVSPNDQAAKLVSPAQKSILTEKITVNNFPELYPNTLQLVHSELVNGKKVLYLKPVTAVGTVNNSLDSKSSELSPVQSGGEQLKSSNQMVRFVSGSRTAASSTSVKSSESNRVYPLSRLLQNDPEVKESNTEIKSPVVSQLRTALAQKLNVIEEKQKGNTIALIYDNGHMRNDVQVIKTLPVNNAGTTISTLSCDNRVKKNEVRVIQNLPVIAPRVNMINVLSAKTHPVHAPQAISHSKIITHSLPSQTNAEVQNHIIVSESLSEFNSGSFGCASVTNEIETSSSCKETMLQKNPATTPGSHILNLDSSKQNVITAESNISVVGLEVPSDVSDMPVLHKVLLADNLSGVQNDKMTFVPADSATPFLINSVPSLNQNGNGNSTETTVVRCHGDAVKNHSEAGLQQSVGAESNNPAQKIVIVDQSGNSANSNAAVIPKPNIKYDKLMRRRQIALQYQQDMQRDREMPKNEKTLELPARNIKVVDSSSQTTLFSMLEPGRMVEMFLNEDSNGANAGLIGNKGVHTDMEHVKSRSHSNNGETILNISSSASCSRFETNGNMTFNKELGPPLSKRLRLNDSDSESLKDMSNSSHNSMSVICVRTNVESQSLNSCFEIMDKENMIGSTNQSTMNSTVNCEDRSFNGNSGSPDYNATNLLSNKEMRQQLFKDFCESVVPDEDGNLPIHNAVMDGNLKGVQRHCLVLIAKKQSVNMQNSMKETPLHLAVLCHNLQIVALLLQYKARSDIPDSEGNTALHMAVKWGNNVDILKTLLTSVEDKSPILNVPNDEGYSPLHLCALQNKSNEAFMLLKKKADVNIQDRKSGRTPLFHAVENKHTGMSRLLVSFGASTTAPNFSGQTPLNASEVTLGEDDSHIKLTKTTMPCSCQNASGMNGNLCASHSEIISDFEGVNIHVLCTNNDELNLLQKVFQCR